MLQIAVKVLVTGILAVAVAEIAKRNTFLSAILASIPFTSVIAMVWLYADTGDTAKVAALATGIFWLILPSFALFISLPILLKQGWGFWPSLSISLGLTVAAYGLMVLLLRKIGIDV